MKNTPIAGLLAALPLALAFQAHAQAPAPADKLVFGSNWYAQAEHGGFYQALAEGLYKKHGLDVTIKMGGPQINVLQLLLAGQYDVAMGDDLQTYKAVEQGLPLVTVATTFQQSPTVLVSHPGPKTLGDLKGKTLYIGQASETTYWPWLKTKYGFTEAQKKPYTFSVQPFLVDKNSAVQGYLASEPYTIETQGRFKPTVFLLGAYGYPPYAQTIVATKSGLDAKKDAIRRFVEASAEGWKSYLKNPAPGNALILKDNPQMTRALLDYGVKALRDARLVDGGDARTQGLLTMTDARWKKTYDFMVREKLLSPKVDYRSAFTTDIVDQVHVLP
ncbi:ABC transporter substrate-binding protein [Pigmentiphaga sp.]|uniref:ABC transporter substrate-binding protein n=1 Tax=Pigmentiphaga sp. TaxID=1977564 RepID=UPI00128E505B|nr:ABC transporter substrate-binding protein [Pigmentiphaga sp.]MPS25391.1 ABC transporter substrate-binding protein [Alcaligenaceae bacterium SAGV5]MPS54005.1 ABC transporter substrate-binding protein [Alcaligenaceae bacterium SAGV3]MPT58954.1 ABC transporter substrate-binding protein [Alcaligenaceae bacterium]